MIFRKNFFKMPVLCTGGMQHDRILSFIDNCFNAQVIKCSDYLNFVILALDYLNNTTNDCFFRLDRHS